jgi:chromate transporter
MIYLELFWTFFVIGAFTFGGGYAMLPLIQIEVVNKGWMANEAVANFVAVSESTPGPFAINMATYVGSEMGGILGAACATLGVVMPSFIIILIVAKCYDRFKKSKLVKGAMSGLKPAVIGMIGTAVLSIGKTVFVQPGMLLSAVLFGAMAVLAFKKVHPIIIICISAAVGVLMGVLGV